MANEQITKTPVAETVVTTPVTETVQTPVTAETPVSVTETSTVETPIAETKVESTPVADAAKPAETLIGDGLDKTKEPTIETKVETPPVEGEKAPTTESKEGQSDEPASPPKYDAFKLPDDVKLEDDRVKGFTDILGELELKSKGVDHALFQEFGQKAVDYHINEVKRVVEDLTKSYQTAWEQQKTSWKDTFLKDPEIGGNRFQTTVDSALTFIRTHGGSAEQQTEFRNLMESSGLGNHPAMIRLLANAGRAMQEGKPLAATKPASAPKSKTQTLYGKG